MKMLVEKVYEWSFIIFRIDKSKLLLMPPEACQRQKGIISMQAGISSIETEKSNDYLMGPTFTVYTDNNPFTHILTYSK